VAEKTEIRRFACPEQNGNVPVIRRRTRNSSIYYERSIKTHLTLQPMVSSLIYLFVFSSWGLGLLSLLSFLSYKTQENSMKIKAMSLEIESKALDLTGKQALLGRISPGKPRTQIPEELRNLMSRSPDHPEVNEIEEGDEVFGVVFKAHSYPPTMEPEDNDNE
jgi:hypothetical protein